MTDELLYANQWNSSTQYFYEKGYYSWGVDKLISYKTVVEIGCCASQFAASLIAAAAFLSSSMVIDISLIFDIYCFSFLGLSMCGDDSESPRYSCGYMTDCSESSNHFCVSVASVVKSLIHDVHLAFCRSLCFDLHYSMEVRWLFGRKNIKTFLKRKVVP